MDLLAWRTAKVQLYLTEAAYVKDSVGRDKIRRNKDTLRELRCLQEILGDLHAGNFGRAPERRRKTVEVAKSRWTALCKAAGSRSVETLCEASPSVKRFFTALPDGTITTPRARSSGSDAATSTRAPSEAVLDLDSHSIATESHLSDVPCPADGAAMSMALRPGGGQRLSRDQLDRLAAELVEQLDQEYTSLLSSIEEVQQLMEAEVAGVSLLPSLDDLDAFVVNADAALKRLEELEAPSFSPCKLMERVEPVNLATADAPADLSLKSPSKVGLRHLETNHELARRALRTQEEKCTLAITETLTDRSLCKDSSATDCELFSEVDKGDSPKSYDSTDDELFWPQSRWTLQESKAVERDLSEQVCTDVVQSEETSQLPSHNVASRPRWADLSDDEGRLNITTRVAQNPHTGRSTRSSTAPARAMCSKCREELVKEKFSRRAWKLARGLGGAGLAIGARESAVCRDCSLDA
mmetsp:Transcript_94493/g.147722  ORF Transcript_94493/g.147722 Transcript_94493/m.147722 type:complete len:468 (-) Transcript_94493:68-1471(-)